MNVQPSESDPTMSAPSNTGQHERRQNVFQRFLITLMAFITGMIKIPRTRYDQAFRKSQDTSTVVPSAIDHHPLQFPTSTSPIKTTNDSTETHLPAKTLGSAKDGINEAQSPAKPSKTVDKRVNAAVSPTSITSPTSLTSPTSVISPTFWVTESSDEDGSSGSTTPNSTSTYRYAYLSHEPFATFQNRVKTLGTELGTTFENPRQVHGGENNRAVAFTIKGPSTAGASGDLEAVLRMNRHSIEDEDEERDEVLDETAILNLVAKHGLPVPKVLGFDISRDNALGQPYALHTLISGTRLDTVYDDMALEDKINIAEQIVQFLARLDKIRFPGAGNLVCGKTAQKRSKMPLDISGNQQTIEQVAIKGFYMSTFPETSDAHKDAKVSLSSFELLQEFLDNRLQYAIAMAISHEVPPANSRVVAEAKKAIKIFHEMEKMGWFSSLQAYSTFHYWDLDPHNFLVQRSETLDGKDGPWYIAGVVDWDDADAVPPVIARKPPTWLWDRKTRIDYPASVSYWFDNDADYLPIYHKGKNLTTLTADGEKIKAHFEAAMAKNIYSELGKGGKDGYVDDAFGKGRWIRRLWRFAQEGMLENWQSKRFHLFVKQWIQYRRCLKASIDDQDSDASWSTEDEYEDEHGFDDEDEDTSSQSNTASSCSTDQYEHESFSTFQAKVQSLATELGTSFEYLQRLKGGSFNRIISLNLRSSSPDSNHTSTEAVVRIPRFSEEEGASDRQEIQDQAAVLNLLAGASLRVPMVLAYDITHNNALGMPFALHTRVPGEGIVDLFADMSLEEKYNIADELVDVLASMDTIRFPDSGYLLCEDSAATPIKLHLKSSEQKTMSSLVKICGFKKEISESRAEPPDSSALHKLLSDCLNMWHQHEQSESDTRFSDMFSKLISALKEMKDMGWFSQSHDAGYSIIHHWDLEPRNILVEQHGSSSQEPEGSKSWRISGVIDWDDALCVPPVLARKPPIWLWDFSDDSTYPSSVLKYYDGDVDYLPLSLFEADSRITAEDVELKKHFERSMAQKLGIDEEAYLDDAYGRGRWLRRLWRFAKEGINGYQGIERFNKFAEDWAEVTKAKQQLA